MTGLFVQLSTLPRSNYLSDLISHISLRHPEMTEIVFADVQPWRIPEIAALPLGHFQKIYVGAPHVPWWGPRADTPTDLQPWMLPVAGVAGMLTPSYRWDQVYTDEALARLHGFDVYIGSEVGIDALGDHLRLRQGWEAYLIELCRRLYAGRPSLRILWSPYAWDLWSSVSAFRRSRIAGTMTTLISNVRIFSGTPGIWTLDLQDGRGAQPAEPETDAVNWHRLIAGCGAEVRINMELFAADLTPVPGEVIRSRAAYYAAREVPVGCCWEARYWLLPLYSNHDHGGAA